MRGLVTELYKRGRETNVLGNGIHALFALFVLMAVQKPSDETAKVFQSAYVFSLAECCCVVFLMCSNGACLVSRPDKPHCATALAISLCVTVGTSCVASKQCLLVMDQACPTS